MLGACQEGPLDPKPLGVTKQPPFLWKLSGAITHLVSFALLATALLLAQALFSGCETVLVTIASAVSCGVYSRWGLFGDTLLGRDQGLSHD